MSLDESEKYLRGEFKNISLIGELRVSKLGTHRLCELFQSIFRVQPRDVRRVVHSVWNKYPLSAMTVTVLIAITDYDGGYWEHFTNRTQCQDVETWKERFLEQIRARHMVLFDEFGARRFVNTILGHAGVPDRSFSGFFEGIIKPAREYQLSAAETLDLLKSTEQPDQLRAFMVHKGVRDYLTEGGKPAQDFVDRCLVAYGNGVVNLPHYTGILPHRVIKHLEKCMTTSGNNSVNSERGSLNKLVQPSLKIDQFIEGIHLALPAQLLGKSSPVQKPCWKIVQVGEVGSSIIPCDTVEFQRSRQFEYRPKRETLSVPPDVKYHVSFCDGDRPLGSWEFSTVGYLIFDPDTSLQIRRSSILQGTSWIVLHKSYAIRPNKAYDNIPQRLAGAWAEYVMHEITASENALLVATSKTQSQSIPILASKEKPTLVLGEFSSRVFRTSVPAFYQVPSIQVPLSFASNLRDVLPSWTLILTHFESSETISVSLSDARINIQLANSSYVIDLSGVVPPAKPGTYQVKIVGSLGTDTQMSFMLLPESLKIVNLSAPRSPKAGYRTENLDIHVDDRYQLTLVSPSNASMVRSGGMYLLTVPISVTLVRLQLYDIKNNYTFEIDCCCRELSWRLTGQQGESFVNEIVEVYPEMFSDGHESRIVISTTGLVLPGHREQTDMTIELVDAHGVPRQSLTKRIWLGNTVVVDVAVFSDTYQHMFHGVGRLRVTIGALRESFVVANYHKMRRVAGVSFSLLRRDATPVLRIEWSNDSGIDSGILRVWDEVHPWEGYDEHPLSVDMTSTELPWGNKKPGYFLFEWSDETPDDVFSFLTKTRYPETTERCVRWMWSPASLSFHSWTIAEAFFNHGLGVPPVDVPCRMDDIEQILVGFKLYGGSFAEYQSGYLDHWRSFAFDRRRELAPILATLDSNMTEHIDDLYWLLGLDEWEVDLIQKCDPGDTDLWSAVVTERLPARDFGETHADLTLIASKHQDDLIQIRQYVYELPRFDDEVLPYNTQVLLLDFLIRFKDSDRTYDQVLMLFKEHWGSILSFVDSFKSIIPKQVYSLLDHRFRDQPPPLLNYFYVVAVTALLCRLVPRGMVRTGLLATGRKILPLIKALSPELLRHDLYFMESYLAHYLSEVQDGITSDRTH